MQVETITGIMAGTGNLGVHLPLSNRQTDNQEVHLPLSNRQTEQSSGASASQQPANNMSTKAHRVRNRHQMICPKVLLRDRNKHQIICQKDLLLPNNHQPVNQKDIRDRNSHHHPTCLLHPAQVLQHPLVQVVVIAEAEAQEAAVIAEAAVHEAEVAIVVVAPEVAEAPGAVEEEGRRSMQANLLNGTDSDRIAVLTKKSARNYFQDSFKSR